VKKPFSFEGNESLILLSIIFIFIIITWILPQTSEIINIVFVGLLLAITMLCTNSTEKMLKKDGVDRRIKYNQKKLEKFYYPLLYVLKLEDIKQKKNMMKNIYPYQYLASSDLMEKFQNLSTKYCNTSNENPEIQRIEDSIIKQLEKEIESFIVAIESDLSLNVNNENNK